MTSYPKAGNLHGYWKPQIDLLADWRSLSWCQIDLLLYSYRYRIKNGIINQGNILGIELKREINMVHRPLLCRFKLGPVRQNSAARYSRASHNSFIATCTCNAVKSFPLCKLFTTCDLRASNLHTENAAFEIPSQQFKVLSEDLCAGFYFVDLDR